MIIGITGNSGSGKTSFIDAIRKQFTEEQVCVLSQDNYYRPKEEQQKDENGIENFDLPTSINSQQFAADIHKLIKGGMVEIPEYTFNNDTAETKIICFKPAPVIIVEGLYVFHEPLIAELLDVRIYMHAPVHLSIIRRIKRDVCRNYGTEDVMYRYQNHVYPSYEKYIAPYLNKVDIIINNEHHFKIGVDMVAAYITAQLPKV